jgi:hypothetical protein
MLALLREEANRYSIVTRSELTPDLPKICADRVQLQQVFIMLNSIEAMKDTGGELTIKTKRICRPSGLSHIGSSRISRLDLPLLKELASICSSGNSGIPGHEARAHESRTSHAKSWFSEVCGRHSLFSSARLEQT